MKNINFLFFTDVIERGCGKIGENFTAHKHFYVCAWILFFRENTE